jgi:carbon monoxide dehydrogenase subunit G
MSVWFDGSNHIDCSIQDVKRALADPGELSLGVVRLLPGMTSVELLDKSPGSITIQTNEGTMTRTAITVQLDADPVTVELDEQYEAGTKVTTHAHFRDEFTPTENGVSHRLIISDVTASGLLGFFYRRLGSAKMGGAFQAAYATYLENAKP